MKYFYWMKRSVIHLLVLSCMLCLLYAPRISAAPAEKNPSHLSNPDSAEAMIVEIWSDIMCPFCYLGKRKFEMALEQFGHRQDVKVVWRSFQLMPDLVTDTSMSIYQLLSDAKGIPLEHAHAMNAQVAEAGKEVGLHYDFDKVMVTNTFKAHCFLKLADESGRQQDAAALLFRAHFEEGRNIDDVPTLLALGGQLGIPTEKVLSMLPPSRFAELVSRDVAEAENRGINGVPYFLFNRSQVVSGAQDPEVFLSALERMYNEKKP